MMSLNQCTKHEDESVDVRTMCVGIPAEGGTHEGARRFG